MNRALMLSMTSNVVVAKEIIFSSLVDETDRQKFITNEVDKISFTKEQQEKEEI